MDSFGNDMSSGGQVLSKRELERRRQRNGECLTCGQKCFQKKFFKTIPLTVAGLVFEGRCLTCHPQDPTKEITYATVRVVGPAASTRNVAASSRNVAASSRNVAASTRNVAATGSLASRGSIVVNNAASNSAANNGSSGRRHTQYIEPLSSTGRRDSAESARSAPSDGYTRHASLEGASPVSLNNRTSSTANSGTNSEANSRTSSTATSGTNTGSNSGTSTEPRDSQGSRQMMTRQFQSNIFPRSAQNGHPSRNPLSQSMPPSQAPQRPPLEPSTSRRESFLKAPSPRPSQTTPAQSPDGLSHEEQQALHQLSLESTQSDFIQIIHIMLMNSISAAVQNEGLHALSLIHDPSEETLAECSDSCGFEVIVSAMGKCAHDGMAQTNACKVLFIASATSEDNQVAIAEAGGMEAIADAMKFFHDDLIVLEGSLLALSNLCIPRQNLGYALETNLIDLTVKAMNASVENCGLQEHGCAVLGNLAVHEEARVRIAECGGGDTIVVSMVVNPMDVEVQIQALLALRNLCVHDEENKVKLANAGAIDAVIGAMQCHRDDATLQERGSWVLSILGMNEDNKLYIGENGGAEVIVRSMWVHPSEAGVQEKGCRALWTLSVDPNNKYIMVDVGAISTIVSAMQNHAADPSIQEKGCGVLANLAANDDNLKIRIVEEEALDVVVMAMVLHGDNEVLQERACTLLRKLCIKANVASMVAANVSPLMAVVAENYPGCREKATYILTQLQVS